MRLVGSRLTSMRAFEILVGLTVLSTSLTACTMAPQEGGATTHDQTNGGNSGDKLLTGAMVIAPSGDFGVMQRNTVTVIVDFKAKTATELAFQGERFVFSKKSNVLYVVKQNRAGVV